MVAYSFKTRFAAPILAGTKGGTIRSDRRRHARPGEALQLYTGMRTRQCRLIARATCISVDRIRLWFDQERMIIGDGLDDPEDGDQYPSLTVLDDFARGDGFANWLDMLSFWRAVHGTAHFDGVWIRWDPKSIVAGEQAA